MFFNNNIKSYYLFKPKGGKFNEKCSKTTLEKDGYVPAGF